MGRERKYQLKENQKVKVFDKMPFELKMAWNANQVGRTFEDRSHKISFLKLDPKIKADLDKNKKTLWNLNGRGKVGNNVEVFPNTEYIYIPNVLKAKQGDYVHIQWTGS